MPFSVAIGALELGLIFAIMALGIYISFRILNVPDLSVDGTFTLGLSVSAIFTFHGMPWIGVICSFFAGLIAGAVTGFLQTKMKIQPILSGIIVMTALYSVNLRVMGNKPNVALGSGIDTVFTPFKDIFPTDWQDIIVLIIMVLAVSGILFWFLKTQIGICLRATGDNEFMVRATSISSDKMKILGLALANGLVAFSGGLFAQQQRIADINTGVGMLVVGLASIILGEVFFKKKSIVFSILAAVTGAILYRFVLSFALQLGLAASDLKLLSAVVLVVIISLNHFKKLGNLPFISKVIKKEGK